MKNVADDLEICYTSTDISSYTWAEKLHNFGEE